MIIKLQTRTEYLRKALLFFFLLSEFPGVRSVGRLTDEDEDEEVDKQQEDYVGVEEGEVEGAVS